MTMYNLSFWLWLICSTTFIFVFLTEQTKSYKLKLWSMTLTQLTSHHRWTGFIYGASLVLAIFGFAGLFIFTPEPIITYIQSVQP